MWWDRLLKVFHVFGFHKIAEFPDIFFGATKYHGDTIFKMASVKRIFKRIEEP
jgi:hypothetical protein